jgi:hypothetical protein
VSAGHRHTLGHEHEFEPQRGLPEPLPAGEKLLWQGSPDWRAMAADVFHLRKLALYFAAMLLLRGVVVVADGGTPVAAAWAAARLLPLPVAGLGLVALLAWLSARSTVYTLTDRRVVMRIGIVLTVTFNLPYRRVAAAALHLARTGHGDIALTLAQGDRIAWLQLWPHARPWRLARPEPSLRAIPEAARVAALLSQAWSAATGQAAVPARGPAAADPGPRPALQTR